MKKIFPTLFLISCLSTGVFADYVQKKGAGFSVSGKSWENFSSLKSSAEKGEPIAMYVLGWAYDEGKAVSENDKKAREWFKKAAPGLVKLAEEGDIDAIVLVAEMYEEGNGLPENKKKAAEWYQRGVNKGNAEAMYQLAELYDDGEGVIKNKEKSRELYKAAADKGHSKAKKKLQDND